ACSLREFIGRANLRTVRRRFQVRCGGKKRQFELLRFGGSRPERNGGGRKFQLRRGSSGFSGQQHERRSVGHQEIREERIRHAQKKRSGNISEQTAMKSLGEKRCFLLPVRQPLGRSDVVERTSQQ